MSLTRILLAGAAAAALSTAASANDTYRCNDRLCYDDQADETRELNRQQLENPGAGYGAVNPPGAYGTPPDDQDEPDDDMNGQGGPYYDAPPGPNDSYGPPPDNYNQGDDDSYDSSDDPDEPAAGDDDDPDDQDQDY